MVEKRLIGQCDELEAINPFHQQQKLYIKCTSYLEDVVGVGGGNLLDIHAAVGTSDHDGPTTIAVHQNGKVGLLGDIQSLGNHDFVNNDSILARLLGLEFIAKHLLHQLWHLGWTIIVLGEDSHW